MLMMARTALHPSTQIWGQTQFLSEPLQVVAPQVLGKLPCRSQPEAVEQRRLQATLNTVEEQQSCWRTLNDGVSGLLVSEKTCAELIFADVYGHSEGFYETARRGGPLTEHNHGDGLVGCGHGGQSIDRNLCI
ncbi:hypothetical protein AB0K60_21315 [Thermopolyspora sp. NPDC052614]|uniref:hypothetical protein n=1 Tax=Thermopolyspora sp. NPDC052614 TaxID=3155682 RepID=UPI00342D060A